MVKTYRSDVFKLQKPLYPAEGDILAYNRTRTIEIELPQERFNQFFGIGVFKIFVKGRVVVSCPTSRPFIVLEILDKDPGW